MANQPARVNLRCLALKRITNAKKIYPSSNDPIFVGALNVGKMKFSFDGCIQINVVANFTQIYEYENLHIKKGERLGISSLTQLLSYLAKKM